MQQPFTAKDVDWFCTKFENGVSDELRTYDDGIGFVVYSPRIVSIELLQLFSRRKNVEDVTLEVTDVGDVLVRIHSLEDSELVMKNTAVRREQHLKVQSTKGTAPDELKVIVAESGLPICRNLPTNEKCIFSFQSTDTRFVLRCPLRKGSRVSIADLNMVHVALKKGAVVSIGGEVTEKAGARLFVSVAVPITSSRKRGVRGEEGGDTSRARFDDE